MVSKEEWNKIKLDPIRYANYKEKQKEYTKKWKENIYKDDVKLIEYRKKKRAYKNKYNDIISTPISVIN